ncbi:restriction endonuclease subunit S [Bifidobacterium imperatoris]|nr:restriction endonuclease subunit S [Bifidobacterium imperatoris]PLS24622.1 type I restriction-modification system specificity subunit [Bifidobacterium imperatoris]
MEERSTVRLGEVITVVNGKNQKAVENPNGRYPIYGSGGIMGRADDYLCGPDTVIIGRKGNINTPIYVTEPFWNVDTAFGLVCDQSQLLPRYLYHFCRFFDFECLNSTVTIPSLTKKNLEKVEIPLPHVNEQNNIVRLLDGIQAQIAISKQMLAKADELIQSRFVEMFGDVRDIDKTVPWHRIDEIASTRLGKMLDRKKQTGNWNRKYLGNHNVQWFKFDLSSLAEMDFAPEDQREFELRAGDILMCEGGEVGRCAIWRGQVAECYFQKALHRIRCDSQIVIPDYLVWVFKMMADAGLLVEHTHAVTIAHLPGVRLKALKVPVPSLTLQNEFAEFVTSVESLKSTTQQQLDRLNTLYASLTQRYFVL